MKVLDVGCSKNKIKGAVGIDIDPDSDADILCDFTKKLPIDDGEYDEVYCKHVLEHLERPEDVVHLVKEIGRVCKTGGRVIFEVPHFSSYVAYSDVTHRRYFSWFMLNGILAGVPHEAVKKEIRFYKFYRFIGIRFLANVFVEGYERFWTYIFPAETLWFEVIKK